MRLDSAHSWGIEIGQPGFALLVILPERAFSHLEI